MGQCTHALGDATAVAIPVSRRNAARVSSLASKAASARVRLAPVPARRELSQLRPAHTADPLSLRHGHFRGGACLDAVRLDRCGSPGAYPVHVRQRHLLSRERDDVTHRITPRTGASWDRERPHRPYSTASALPGLVRRERRPTRGRKWRATAPRYSLPPPLRVELDSSPARVPRWRSRRS
jgi:hypothetical protein